MPETLRKIELSDGQTWSVQVQGSGSPLVLLHGYPLDHRLWKYQIEAFSRKYQVIVPDLPGFGQSPPSRETVLTMGALSQQISDLLDRCDIRQPITLVGLSLGGYIALEFCQRFADRLKALIFCDSRVIADNDAQRSQRLKVADTIEQEGIEPIITSMLPKLLAEATFRKQPETVEFVKQMMRSASYSGIAAIQRGMAARRDFSDLLSTFAFPVLCLVGKEDAISTPAEMQGFSHMLPQGNYIEIPDAGHLSVLEQPALVNTVLREFMS